MQFSGSPRITTPWFTFALSIILKSHRASSSGGRFEGFRQDLPRETRGGAGEGRTVRTLGERGAHPITAQVVGAGARPSCIYAPTYMYTHYNECGSFSLARPLFLPTNYESFLLLLKLLINRSGHRGQSRTRYAAVPPSFHRPFPSPDTYIRPC